MDNSTPFNSPIPDGFKKCTKCGAVKAVSEFALDRRAKGNYQSKCKACEKQYYQVNRERILQRNKQYRQENHEHRLEHGKKYYQENREQILERGKKYRQENTERIRQYYQVNRESILEHNKQYHRENREHLSERKKQYYQVNRKQIAERNKKNRQKNRERIAERDKQYRQKNRERVHVYLSNYHARKRGLPNTLTPSNWQHALDYFHGCCAVCERPLKDLFGTHTAARDHWIPLASPECPGTIPTNIIPLCHGVGGCNNSKKETPPDIWLKEQFGEKQAKKILQRIEQYFEWVKNQS